MTSPASGASSSSSLPATRLPTTRLPTTRLPTTRLPTVADHFKRNLISATAAQLAATHGRWNFTDAGKALLRQSEAAHGALDLKKNAP